MTTTTTAPTALRTITSGLTALGYIEGAPSHVNADAIEIDRQVAEEAVCEACGQGMTFRAFRRGRSYVALAVCNCGNAIEF